MTPSGTSSVLNGAAVREAGRPGTSSERSLDLAGSIIKARYQVNAIASVSADVVVYAAEELRYGRPVALEVLRDEVAADPAFVAAVRDRAFTLAMSVHVHRGLPRVYECGMTETGELFIALEPTTGPTLRDVLDARGALDPSTALRIASEVGETLETLHHNRIVHGRLGPDSVRLVTDSDGKEHIILVGVELTAAYRTPMGLRRRDASPPAYLAPEQIERGETIEATDQYALGMLLRELLIPPTAPETSVPDAEAPVVPPAIERIITTALDTRPGHRYPDLSVMVNDMWAAHTVLAEPESRPRPVKRPVHSHRRARPRRSHATLGIATAVATAAIAAVIGWLALSDGIVSRVRARITRPAISAVPVHQSATPPSVAPIPAVASPVALSPPLAREETPAHASTVEAHPDPAAAPRPAPVAPVAPVAERQERSVPAVVHDRPRPAESRAPAARADSLGTDTRDGSAAVDWLLKPRR